MRKLAILLLLTVGVFYSSPSPAFEGQYRAGSKEYRQELTIKKQAADSYHVELVVGTEGCSGYFEGVGRVEGATLVVKAPPDDPDGGTCAVSISRKGAKLEVTEEDCNGHGASCEFAATYKRR
ncbi:MAG: hypothetical protein ACLQDM_00075 [Bradyrhizobium sp.]